MSELFHKEEEPQFFCWDRKYYSEVEDQVRALKDSKTVYVGNLSFFTTELQIHETFSVVGPIKRIIMGLNANTKTPCGFCFVEYYTREQVEACLKFVSETVCDERIIRADMDGGFKPGRQYGRGKSGGQIRDERSNVVDPARTGYKEALPPPPIVPTTRKRARTPEDSLASNIEKLNSGLASSRPPPPSIPAPASTLSTASSKQVVPEDSASPVASTKQAGEETANEIATVEESGDDTGPLKRQKTEPDIVADADADIVVKNSEPDEAEVASEA